MLGYGPQRPSRVEGDGSHASVGADLEVFRRRRQDGVPVAAHRKHHAVAREGAVVQVAPARGGRGGGAGGIYIHRGIGHGPRVGWRRGRELRGGVGGGIYAHTVTYQNSIHLNVPY